MMDPLLKRAIKHAAKKNNVTYEDARIAYESVFLFMRDSIADLDLKNMSEEEFKSKKTSFNIPRLGKFAIWWKYIDAIRRNIKKKQDAEIEY